MNGTNYFRVLPFALFSTTLIILTIVGNLLVILTVIKSRELRKRHQNWFLVSLAFSDFSVGLLVVPFSMLFEIIGEWKFGEILCEIWLALDVLFVTASILNLCLISLDRFWTIENPTSYLQKRTIYHVILMVAFTWFLAMVISFPPLFGWREKSHSESEKCEVSTEIGYVLYSALGSFFVPASVLLYVYAKIFMLAKRRIKQKLKSSSEVSKAVANRTRNIDCPKIELTRGQPLETLSMEDTDKVSEEPPVPKTDCNRNKLLPLSGRRNVSFARLAKAEALKKQASVSSLNSHLDPSDNCEIILKKKYKALKKKEIQATMTLGVIVLSFIGCWAPFFAVYIIGPSVSIPKILFSITFWLGYCNSVMNPIIYVVMNKQFRPALKSLLHLNRNSVTHR